MYICVFYIDSNNRIKFTDILNILDSIDYTFIRTDYFVGQIKNIIDESYKKDKDIDISIKYNKDIDICIFQDIFLERSVAIYPVDYLRNDVNVPIICNLKK